MPGSPIRLADKSLFFRAFCKIQPCSDWQCSRDATIPSITAKSKHFSDFSRDAIFSMQHAASNLFCVCQHEALANFSPASENLHTNGSQCIIKDIFGKGRPTYMNLSTKASSAVVAGRIRVRIWPPFYWRIRVPCLRIFARICGLNGLTSSALYEPVGRSGFGCPVSVLLE
jgi:hypothetical protein